MPICSAAKPDFGRTARSTWAFAQLTRLRDQPRDEAIAGELVRLSLGGRGPERPELTPPGYRVEQTMRLMLEEMAAALERLTPWQLEILRELPTRPRDAARAAHIPRITVAHLDALHEHDRWWRR